MIQKFTHFSHLFLSFRGAGNKDADLYYYTRIFNLAVDVLISFKTEYSYLHEKIHNIRGHLFNKNFNDSQNFPFSSGKSCGVHVLLGLGICCKSSMSVHLEKHFHVADMVDT